MKRSFGGYFCCSLGETSLQCLNRVISQSQKGALICCQIKEIGDVLLGKISYAKTGMGCQAHLAGYWQPGTRA